MWTGQKKIRGCKYDYEDKKNKLERSRGTYETNLKERMAELELRKKELEKLKRIIPEWRDKSTVRRYYSGSEY